MKTVKTSINCNRVGNCSLTLVLDKRTNKETMEYPMAICFTIERKRYYHKLTDMPFQPEKYFNSVCSVTSSRSNLMDVYKGWQEILEEFRDKVVKLSKSHELTIGLIKTMLSGVEYQDEHSLSFVGMWEGLIARYRDDNRVAVPKITSGLLTLF